MTVTDVAKFISNSPVMEHDPPPKWQGKATATLPKATADQVFSCYTDFFNFHKWFPNLSTCYGIHGANGEPGCVRYLAGFSIPSNGGEAAWSKERLLTVDRLERSLSYEIVDCNIGFRSYVATVKILPAVDDDEGCVIDWSFSVDPVEGWKLEDLVKKYEVGLQRIVQRMSEVLAT